MPEHPRTKPRVTIVMRRDLHEEARRLAAADGRSLSAWLERLVEDEARRAKRRKVASGEAEGER